MYKHKHFLKKYAKIPAIFMLAGIFLIVKSIDIIKVIKAYTVAF